MHIHGMDEDQEHVVLCLCRRPFLRVKRCSGGTTNCPSDRSNPQTPVHESYFLSELFTHPAIVYVKNDIPTPASTRTPQINTVATQRILLPGSLNRWEIVTESKHGRLNTYLYFTVIWHCWCFNTIWCILLLRVGINDDLQCYWKVWEGLQSMTLWSTLYRAKYCIKCTLGTHCTANHTIII